MVNHDYSASFDHQTVDFNLTINLNLPGLGMLGSEFNLMLLWFGCMHDATKYVNVN